MTKEELKRVTTAPPYLPTRVDGIRTGWYQTHAPSVAIVMENGRRVVRHLPAGLCITQHLSVGQDTDLKHPVVRHRDADNREIIWRAI